MKKISGYVDITPADFKEIYDLAYRHALERLVQSVTAENIMTKAVISVNSDTALTDTAKSMADKSISGLPVIAHPGKNCRGYHDNTGDYGQIKQYCFRIVRDFY